MTEEDCGEFLPHRVTLTDRIAAFVALFVGFNILGPSFGHGSPWWVYFIFSVIGAALYDGMLKAMDWYLVAAARALTGESIGQEKDKVNGGDGGA